MTCGKMTGNYWVFKVVEETGGLYRRLGIEVYNHRTREAFWPIKANPEKAKSTAKLQELKEGDLAVFYLVEKGRAGRFLGTAILGSDYQKLETQQEKAILHKEFLDSNCGVFLKTTETWQVPLPVDAVRGVGAFAGGRGFSQFFEGSVKRLKNKQEFDTILQQHKSLSR